MMFHMRRRLFREEVRHTGLGDGGAPNPCRIADFHSTCKLFHWTCPKTVFRKTKSWPSSLFQDIDNRQAAANAAFRKAATSCSLLAVGPAGDTAELKIRSRVGAKYVRCVRRQPKQNRRIRTYILTHQYLRVWKKYVNIPSEKYIYVHIYVCICVYTYLCKMDERRSYASLSKKWMSAGIMLACHKNVWVPVLCWLVIKMDEYRYYAVLS